MDCLFSDAFRIILYIIQVCRVCVCFFILRGGCGYSGRDQLHTQLKKNEYRHFASKIKTLNHSSCVSLKCAACLFQIIGNTSLLRNYFVNAGEGHVTNKKGNRGNFVLL